MRNSARTLSILACTAALGACSTGLMPAQSAQTAAGSETVTRGQTIYAKECAICHGATGDGSGPA